MNSGKALLLMHKDSSSRRWLEQNLSAFLVIHHHDKSNWPDNISVSKQFLISQKCIYSFLLENIANISWESYDYMSQIMKMEGKTFPFFTI